jgi:hypothetical protein
MNRIVLPGVAVLMAVTLWGCGQGDDKGKDKKAEPAPAPKATPAPPAPPKPAPKAESKPKPAAKGEGWTVLGQQKADDPSGKERIVVQGKGGTMKEIMVSVEGAPVEIDGLVVTFGNDEQFKPALRDQFKPGTWSRAIDLPGDKRAIKHVEFSYKGSGGTVTLHGRK